jgi:pilus assembly protein CpaE
MGTMENQFGISARTALGSAGAICVAASERYLADLRLAPALQRLGPIEFIALDPGAALPHDLLRNRRVLVVEVDPGDAGSMARVRNLRDGYPDLKVIVAISDANVALVRTLVRQGVFDVCELPFSPNELASQILDASSVEADDLEFGPLAPLHLVAGSNGGVGATGLLTHLAAALVEQGKGKLQICVADFDLQAGEVASYCGVSAPVTMSALIEAGDRLDEELVGNAILETRHGFSIVAAPDTVLPLDVVESEHIELIVTALRRKFDIVLVDLPSAWTNWSLSLATQANSILMLTDSSISSLRQARRRIDLFESLGIKRENVKVIANRVERRLFRTVGTEEIAHALRAEVVGSLNDEGGALRAAQDQGALLQEATGRTGYGKGVSAIAAQLLELES